MPDGSSMVTHLSPHDEVGMAGVQIKIVEDGKFYIWDIASPDIDVKPVS